MTNEDLDKAEELKRGIKIHQHNITVLNDWEKDQNPKGYGIKLESAYIHDKGWLEYTIDDVEKIIELEKETIKSMEEEFERL